MEQENLDLNLDSVICFVRFRSSCLISLDACFFICAIVMTWNITEMQDTIMKKKEVQRVARARLMTLKEKLEISEV